MIVNNAGFVLGVEKVGEISEADIEAMFNTNVFGLIAVTQLLIKGMTLSFNIAPRHVQVGELCMIDFKEKRSGHIINIGSVAGRESYAGGAIYCATKHAVSAFTGSLLREVVDTPIRVTELQPGMVETGRVAFT